MFLKGLKLDIYYVITEEMLRFGHKQFVYNCIVKCFITESQDLLCY